MSVRVKSRDSRLGVPGWEGMAADGDRLPFRVTGTSGIKQWGYSLVDIKITAPYTLKRLTLCYMNYISIFKNRGKRSHTT